MQILISRNQAEKIGFDHFAIFGHGRHSWGYRQNKKVAIDLDGCDDSKLTLLEKMFANPDVYGRQKVLSDLKFWRDAKVSGVSGAKVKNLVQFRHALQEFFKDIPGHRCYMQDEGIWFGYLMNGATYHPEVHHRKTKWNDAYTDPEYVTMDLYYENTLAGKRCKTISFHDEVEGHTIKHALHEKDVYHETDELRADYLKMTKRWQKWHNSIGKQLLATGSAEFKNKGDSDNWWRNTTTTFSFVNAKVVVDVAKEGEDGNEEEEKEQTVWESEFWKTEVENEESGEKEMVGEPNELPLHHFLNIFHLSKHIRMTMHISALQKYKFDTNLINKLIIDDRRKALVKLLIKHRGSKYADIIGNKSGGAIVMLCGKPGTGKTLTAEVFAESEKRALYSVQCSQLGTTPEELETQLLKVLARAQRWKAVLLLDEADVYVHKRGHDVNQNAMVGVFLRVLEYQNAVLFMTTNREKDIDDAVASRCTAKLVYEYPTFDEQCKIWRVLCDASSVQMSDEEIKKTAKQHPELSGRDVKNLLKLAMLVTDKALTAETVTFVKQFKPT